MITKPMLAGKVEDLAAVRYPVLVTPKLDGIRCLKINGKALTRSFKPIPNKHIREWIESNLPDGVDGELMCEGTFQEATGGVMRESGEPEFTYYIFDYITGPSITPYVDRMKDLKRANFNGHCKLVLPVEVRSETELKVIEEKFISEGFEGLMMRTPNSPYKFGRSTEREGWLLKLKRFEDDEAIVIAINEQMHNENEAQKDAFGRTKRSTAKAGLVGSGVAGGFIVKCKKFRNDFGIGMGDSEMAKEVWANRGKYIGAIVKFKYQPIGSTVDAPRFPGFVGFRDKRDISK